MISVYYEVRVVPVFREEKIQYKSIGNSKKITLNGGF